MFWIQEEEGEEEEQTIVLNESGFILSDSEIPYDVVSNSQQKGDQTMDESPIINNNLAQEEFSEDPKLAERLVFIDSNTSLGDVAPYTTLGWKKLIKRVSLHILFPVIL